MPLKQINVTDRKLQMIQDNTAQAVASLESTFFQNGSSITVALTSGQDNLVSHKLGRTPQGFVVTNSQVNSTVWSPATSALGNANWTTTQINLRCSTSGTFTLWIA